MYYLEGYYKFNLTDSILSKVFFSITSYPSNLTTSGSVIVVNPANTNGNINFKGKVVNEDGVYTTRIYARNYYYSMFCIQYAVLQDNTAALNVKKDQCKAQYVELPTGTTNYTVNYIKPIAS